MEGTPTYKELSKSLVSKLKNTETMYKVEFPMDLSEFMHLKPEESVEMLNVYVPWDPDATLETMREFGLHCKHNVNRNEGEFWKKNISKLAKRLWPTIR